MDTTREFDIVTKNKLIECKNINWSKITLKDIDRARRKFANQEKIATSQGKIFEVHSKQLIPQDWKEWFVKKGITFFEG
jgi:hypothetical protein